MGWQPARAANRRSLVVRTLQACRSWPVGDQWSAASPPPRLRRPQRRLLSRLDSLPAGIIWTGATPLRGRGGAVNTATPRARTRASNRGVAPVHLRCPRIGTAGATEGPKPQRIQQHKEALPCTSTSLSDVRLSIGTKRSLFIRRNHFPATAKGAMPRSPDRGAARRLVALNSTLRFFASDTCIPPYFDRHR